MNKTKFLLITIAGILLLVCCQRDVQSLDGVAIEHTFRITAELPPMDQEIDTKGYLGSYISANWAKDDKVSVVNLTTGKILAGNLTADRAGTSALFGGKVSGAISSGDVIALWYPAFDVTQETDFQTRTINLQEQNNSSKVPLVAYSTFTVENVTGQFTGLQMKFYYVLSYLKLNMANLPSVATISKMTLRNVPSSMSVTINDQKNDFVVGSPEEKAAKDKITINGPFETSEAGTLMVAAGILPAKESSQRSIVVTIDSLGDFLSPLASSQFESHKYYNTVASKFEHISLPGVQDYGIYNIDKNETVDAYQEFSHTLITGSEKDKADFTMLNIATYKYWSLKGIPVDAVEGTTFSAQIVSNGINYQLSGQVDDAIVKLIEPDGEFSKLWIKSKELLFIVRK
ncbi:MAG: hypothetical protein KBS95_08535 [Alistipes sp.]|nr:hypothetical protein [Candidatus Alistipes equi]